MRAGDWAWVVILSLVVAYELFCPPGQLLSQAMDAYRAAHPFLVQGAIVYLAGHLTRVWPAHFDPLTVLGIWLGR